MVRQSDLHFTFTMMGKTTTAIDFGEILNRDTALTIWRTHEWQEDEPVRHIYGMVTRFEQGASAAIGAPIIRCGSNRRHLQHCAIHSPEITFISTKQTRIRMTTCIFGLMQAWRILRFRMEPHL